MVLVWLFIILYFNSMLFADGNIYMVTPIDPLFLLIPLIYKVSFVYQNSI